MLAVTLDIDWSPDPIVDAVMEVFEKKQIPVTLFCTNPDTDRSGNSTTLRGRYDERHELALHPNFADFVDYERVLSALLAHYPDARGFQSHNGNTGWPIWSAASQNGLTYEVDCRVFPVHVPPFALGDPEGFRVFVNRFMDANLLHQGRANWSTADIGLTREVSAKDCLFIVKFHPNIIYYDMRSTSEYRQHKPYYHEPREELSFRRNLPRGAAKLLFDLLSSVERDHFTTISNFGQSLGLWPAADLHHVGVLNDLLATMRESTGVTPVATETAARRTAVRGKTSR